MFHSVPVADQIIDNIVVGANGIYAVDVFAPPKQLAKTVRLEGNQLLFDIDDVSVSLAEHKKKIRLLVKELTPVVGHPVTVLSVANRCR